MNAKDFMKTLGIVKRIEKSAYVFGKRKNKEGESGMYFLVDYENVNYDGLEGTVFLNREDTVIIFYSSVCDKITNSHMRNMRISGCNFDICQLQSVRKNALDFYIASKVGEIFTVEQDAKIAIISRDSGYLSVIDYWRQKLEIPNRLVQADNIREAITSIDGEEERKKIVTERLNYVQRSLQTETLESEYANYKNRKKIIDGIKELVTGTVYEYLFPSITELLLTSERPKVLP